MDPKNENNPYPGNENFKDTDLPTRTNQVGAGLHQGLPGQPHDPTASEDDLDEPRDENLRDSP
jgi:hypothetical protein